MGGRQLPVTAPGRAAPAHINPLEPVSSPRPRATTNNRYFNAATGATVWALPEGGVIGQRMAR